MTLLDENGLPTLEAIEEAFRLAAQDAIDIARRFGTPFIVGEGDKVLRLTPDEAQERLDRVRNPQAAPPDGCGNPEA